ncbi:hypothetical protein [Ruegeria sp. Alg231-54]|uniref:hypothetical protein n=1 Tax=Ruegeria sp. Alg231-54 TaxID=1922221 RepID=UPI000D55D407|nr:hypothetical protein [Ruegeria sp. Alg231-54]
MRSVGGSTTKRRAAERIERAFAIIEEQVGKMPRRDAIDMAVKETALAIRNHAAVTHYHDALALGASPDEAREGIKPGKWTAFKRSLK